MQNLRIAAICNEPILCTGLRLVGIECHHVTTETEWNTVLTALPVADIGLLVISKDLSGFALPEYINPETIIYILE